MKKLNNKLGEKIVQIGEGIRKYLQKNENPSGLTDQDITNIIKLKNTYNRKTSRNHIHTSETVPEGYSGLVSRE